MRLVLSIGELVLLDVRLLEPAEVEEAAEPAGLVESTATIDSGPIPYGFRPAPDPWPPSWQ